MAEHEPKSLSVSFSEFKERHKISHIIGVMGGSDQTNEQEISGILYETLHNVRLQFPNIALLSGGTKGGIPEIIVKVANSLGIPCVGVFPEACDKYVLKDELDFQIPVPPPILGNTTWGSETPVFADLADVYIVIGGEWGTLVEAATILKNNKSKLKRGEKPIRIICLEHFGGIAEILEKIAFDIGLSSDNILTITDNNLKRVLASLLAK